MRGLKLKRSRVSTSVPVHVAFEAARGAINTESPDLGLAGATSVQLSRSPGAHPTAHNALRPAPGSLFDHMIALRHFKVREWFPKEQARLRLARRARCLCEGSLRMSAELGPGDSAPILSGQGA